MTIKELTEYNPDELLNLYSVVGWINYTNKPEILEKSYKNSLLSLGAYDDGKLIGAIRAVGDGVSIVFIQDLLVLPEYRRRGIGTRLLREIVERFSSVYQIELLADHTPETVSFYRSVGFAGAADAGCCAFIRIRVPS